MLEVVYSFSVRLFGRTIFLKKGLKNMSELIFSYLISISNVLIPCIFIRMVADIFRDFVFMKGGK